MKLNTPCSFDQAVAEYLAWYRAEHEEHPNSARRIEVSFRALAQSLGGMPLDQISAAELEAFKASRRRKVKPVTIRHDLHALSGLFRFAIRLGWASTNPVRLIVMPSDAGAVRMRVLTAAEEETYLGAAQIHASLYALARIMLATGMRSSEVLSLRTADVDLAGCRVRVRQGKTAAARRTIRVVGDTADLVIQLARRGEEWLFPGLMPGRPRTKLNNRHRDACERAGVARFCLYDLRHTFASRMAARGMPLTTLAAILGHSNLRCVMRYVHPSQSVMDEAMERFAE